MLASTPPTLQIGLSKATLAANAGTLSPHPTSNSPQLTRATTTVALAGWFGHTVPGPVAMGAGLGDGLETVIKGAGLGLGLGVTGAIGAGEGLGLGFGEGDGEGEETVGGGGTTTSPLLLVMSYTSKAATFARSVVAVKLTRILPATSVVLKT